MGQPVEAGDDRVARGAVVDGEIIELDARGRGVKGLKHSIGSAASSDLVNGVVWHA